MKLSKTELQAALETSPRASVPFNKLVLSTEHQVRAAGTTPRSSIAELAASILQNNILQNLIVVKGAHGMFEVCAGGRRLEALTLLVNSGDLPTNYPVPVLIVPVEQALISSLSENTLHVPMHPADEYAAFAKLIGEGKSVEDVAASFGLTPLVVKRRMKLASVSPKLMTEFRAGAIGLDCLMVLASVDDHQRQEQTWAGVPTWSRRPETLRRLLAQGEFDSNSDPVARFVGVEAYQKAGGAVRRDLFCEENDDKVYLLDAQLLEQLALDKLQDEVALVTAAGWKWVDVRVRLDHDEYVKHHELRKTSRAPSEHEATMLADLEARLTVVRDQLEEVDRTQPESDEDAYSMLEGQADDLQTQIDNLQESQQCWSADLMALTGCVVHVGSDGRLARKCGLMRPEDRSAMVKAARAAGEGSAGEQSMSLPATKTRPVHSDKLMRQLTAHRVAAIQAELLAQPDIALAAITAHLAIELMTDVYRRSYGYADALRLSATNIHTGLQSEADDVRAGAAWQRMDAERRAWVARLPQSPDRVFSWVLEQDKATVLQLLTFLTASTVTGVCGEERDQQGTDALAGAVGLDMRKWWSATKASYFNHVSKGRVLEVITQAMDAAAAQRLVALKKDAAASWAANVLANSGWLPTCLRTRATAVAGDEPPRTDQKINVDESSMAA